MFDYKFAMFFKHVPTRKSLGNEAKVSMEVMLDRKGALPHWSPIHPDVPTLQPVRSPDQFPV